MPAAGSKLKQCRLAQDQLGKAIDGVLKTQQLLRDNAREVRWQLQSCVSRQQEALRCRELWLLGQIELLEHVKVETLQQQLHQLHRMHGQLDAISQQLQSATTGSGCSDLTNQLTSCMDKLSSLSLLPEETPEMTFTADARSLREAITSFGSITAQDSHAGGDWSNQSRHFSMDVQGGAPVDWLPEGGPRLGTEAGQNQASRPAPASADFLKAWGQLRDLEAWLLQDQKAAGRQRSQSEASAAAAASSSSFEMIDESDLCEAPRDDDLSKWLAAPPAVRPEPNAGRQGLLLEPFSERRPWADWLAGPGCSSSCCRQSTRALEIENLGQLKCLKTPPPACTAPPAASGLEAWLQRALPLPLPQTCRANEPCSSYSECVCDENCGREALNAWLLQHGARDKNGVPVSRGGGGGGGGDVLATAKNFPPPLQHRQQEQKVQAILEAWLHPSNPASSRCGSLSNSLFWRPLDAQSWMLPEKWTAPQRDDTGPLRNKCQERVTVPSVCDSFSGTIVGGDPEKWLHKPPPVQV